MTDDELTKLIHDNELFHGTVGIGVVMDMKHIKKFAALIAAAEREACADVAENWRCNGMPRTILAEQIRARGQK